MSRENGNCSRVCRHADKFFFDQSKYTNYRINRSSNALLDKFFIHMKNIMFRIWQTEEKLRWKFIRYQFLVSNNRIPIRFLLTFPLSKHCTIHGKQGFLQHSAYQTTSIPVGSKFSTYGYPLNATIEDLWIHPWYSTWEHTDTPGI